MHLTGDADVQGPVERLPLDDLDGGSRRDAALAQEPEHGRVGVGNADERAALTGLEGIEAAALVRRHGQLAARDRIAVRVEGRIAELRGDQLLQLLGEDVLQHLRLGVDFVPGHAEALHEEELEQPMVADDLERDAGAVLGEADPAVGLVLDETEGRQLGQHPGDRGGADLQPLRERRRRHGALAGVERVDRLDVVLDGGRDTFRHA